MPRGAPDGYEQAAARILAAQLGGTARALDVPGAAERTPDLEVVIADGRTIAVEITTAADEAIEALHRLAIEREWPAPSLAYHWWLGVPNNGNVRVKALMRGVVRHLEVLERNDVEQIGGLGRVENRRRLESASGEVAHATREVFALGADRANRLGKPKPGETSLVMASLHGSASSNFDTLNAMVTERANAKAEKLATATADERHLFVWVRPSVPGHELTMGTLPPPEETPKLPEAVDVAWVATAPLVLDSPQGRLWRVRPPGRWEEIDTSVG